MRKVAKLDQDGCHDRLDLGPFIRRQFVLPCRRPACDQRRVDIGLPALLEGRHAWGRALVVEHGGIEGQARPRAEPREDIGRVGDEVFVVDPHHLFGMGGMGGKGEPHVARPLPRQDRQIVGRPVELAQGRDGGTPVTHDPDHLGIGPHREDILDMADMDRGLLDQAFPAGLFEQRPGEGFEHRLRSHPGAREGLPHPLALKREMAHPRGFQPPRHRRRAPGIVRRQRVSDLVEEMCLGQGENLRMPSQHRRKQRGAGTRMPDDEDRRPEWCARAAHVGLPSCILESRETGGPETACGCRAFSHASSLATG